ncbi:MAG: hypothetical protein ACRDSR_07250 [Pseudonocardiaceae bacterium]
MTDPGYDKPTTAEAFLKIWYVLADADNTPQLEQWERHFPELADTAPDVTLDILRELASSDANGAKEAAAIYSRCVFAVRPGETTELLVTLFHTGDPDIQGNVLDTIDTLTTDPQTMNPIQAANLITAVRNPGG